MSRSSSPRGRRRPSEPLDLAHPVVVYVAVAFVALFGYIWWIEGRTAYRVANGGGVVGTVTLERRVGHRSGRYPTSWSWEGTFRSADGEVIRTVEMERLPGDTSDSARPTGGWNAGDQVEARWSSATPGDAYLPHTRRFRYWVEGTIIAVVIIILMLLAWWGARRFKRAYPDGLPYTPVPASPAANPKISEREATKARLATNQAHLDELRRELDRIRTR